MITRTALFRADGSPSIGAGHVARCLSLANALGARGWRCAMLTNREAHHVFPRLVTSGHQLIDVTSRGATDPLVMRELPLSDWLVVDHYDLDSAYEREARSTAEHIMAIDDLANRPHDCDLLLDQNPGRARSDYDGHVPSRSSRLMGPMFALLRPEFAAAREAALARRSERVELERLLIIMGATDPANATGFIIQALAQSGRRMKIDVVLSRGAPHLEAVEAALSKYAVGGQLHLDPTNLAELMATADIAVCAGGVTALECACVGLPLLILTTALNQRVAAGALAHCGAAEWLGSMGDVSTRQFLGEFWRIDRGKLAAMSSAAAAVCDGRGAERVADVIVGEVASSIVLRPASIDDAQRLHHWRNDIDTRNASRSTDVIAFDDHCRWLEHTLSDENRFLLIAEWRGRPVGTVRGDRIGDVVELSWTVDPECRGAGIGAAMLRKALARCPGSVVAHIHKNNVISQRMAVRVGLTLASERGEWVAFSR